jgi:hypothetical protein
MSIMHIWVFEHYLHIIISPFAPQSQVWKQILLDRSIITDGINFSVTKQLIDYLPGSVDESLISRSWVVVLISCKLHLLCAQFFSSWSFWSWNSWICNWFAQSFLNAWFFTRLRPALNLKEWADLGPILAPSKFIGKAPIRSSPLGALGARAPTDLLGPNSGPKQPTSLRTQVHLGSFDIIFRNFWNFQNFFFSNN